MNTPQPHKPLKPFATWLRLAAFVGAIVIDVLVWPRLVAAQNPTTFNALFIGVPVLLTLLPLLLGLTSHEQVTTPATWVCAGLLTAGSILFGLTVGAYFLIPAIILVLAAIVQTGHARQHNQPARSPR